MYKMLHTNEGRLNDLRYFERIWSLSYWISLKDVISSVKMYLLTIFTNDIYRLQSHNRKHKVTSHLKYKNDNKWVILFSYSRKCIDLRKYISCCVIIIISYYYFYYNIIVEAYFRANKILNYNVLLLSSTT